MTSWRDSSDPRCPECGGKITSTATYCMHCDADLEPDADTGTEYPSTVDSDVSSADDVSYGTDADHTSDADPGTGFSTGTDSDVGIETDEQSDVGVESSDRPEVGIGSTEQPDVGAGADADQVEETTLLLRAPVTIIVSFFAALLSLMGALAGDIPMAGALLVFVLAWIGVTAYLLQKPLASDAIGDGFYVYAVMVLLIPPIWVVSDLVKLALGNSVDITNNAGAAVAFEFFLLFPAGVMLLVGYGFNYYAKQKVEAALGERSGQ